jgi:hypothetical protein
VGFASASKAFMPFIDVPGRSMPGSRAAKPPGDAKSFQFFPIYSKGRHMPRIAVFQILNPFTLHRGGST